MTIAKNNSTEERLTDDLKQLQFLLLAQIELVNKGKLSELERLSEQVNALVADLAAKKVFETDEFRRQRDKFRKLYDSLSLSLNTKKDDTARELKRIRKGKRALNAYHSRV